MMVNPVLVSPGYMGDGGDFGTGNMAKGMNDFAQRRKDDRMQALGLREKSTANLKTRYINNAVSNVLDMKPTVTREAVAPVGKEGEVGYIPGQAEVLQTPDEYSMSVKQKMGEIHDIDPMVALGLSQKITEPYRTQSNADRLFGFNEDKESNLQTYRENTLEQQDTNSKRSFNKGKYKTFTDDYGKSWKYNSNTGKMEEINTGAYGSNGLGRPGSKGNPLTSITNRDGLGVETTKQVPKYVLDENNQVILNPEATGIKRPTLTQKDKDFTKNYGQGNTVIDNVRGTFGNTGIWGGLDARTGPVGAFFGTKEGSNQSLLKQDLENLRLEATNKLAGVLSNQDMQIILDTIPTVSDQPEVAREKLAKVEASIADADANQFNRLAQSNPASVNNIAVGMVNDPSTIPVGYNIEHNSATGEFRLRKKVSK